MRDHPALTVRQPHAQFLVTPLPCSCGSGNEQHAADCASHRKVKTFETRPRRPPQGLVGQRLDIHAGKRDPGRRSHDLTDPIVVGDYSVRFASRAAQWRLVREIADDGTSGQSWWLDLGAVIADARLVAAVPILRQGFYSWNIARTGALIVSDEGDQLAYYRPGIERGENSVDVSHELPYGEFVHGRWGWLLGDVRPIHPPLPRSGRLGVWWHER